MLWPLFFLFTYCSNPISSSRTNKTLFQLINFKVIRNDAVLILSHWSDEAVKYMDLKKVSVIFVMYGVEL